MFTGMGGKKGRGLQTNRRKTEPCKESQDCLSTLFQPHSDTWNVALYLPSSRRRHRKEWWSLGRGVIWQIHWWSVPCVLTQHWTCKECAIVVMGTLGANQKASVNWYSFWLCRKLLVFPILFSPVFKKIRSKRLFPGFIALLWWMYSFVVM